MTVSRRNIIIAASVAGFINTRISATDVQDFAPIERDSGGRLGFWAYDVSKGRSIGWREDARFPFCSSAKAPLVAFVLWNVDCGKLYLDNRVTYSAADLLPHAPTTRAAVGQGWLSIRDLCRAAVVESDNTAANLLWRITGGPHAMTAWMRSLGDTVFDLNAVEPGLNLARFGDSTNTTTPRAAGVILGRFITGNVLSAASRSMLTGWLIANTAGSARLRAGLPPTWRVGDKTGTYNEGWFSTVDVAVAWPPEGGPIILSGMTTDTHDTASGEQALARASTVVAEWFSTHATRGGSLNQ